MAFGFETHPPNVIPNLPVANVGRPQVIDIVSAQNDRGIPVQRLPTEILLYIFIWYTSWSEVDWQADKRIDRRPILLSHVCSKWRRIVLESSTLWTCIPFHSDVDARTTIIHRSREQSVDIVHCHVPSVVGRVDRWLVKTLQDMADRWRSVLWDSCEDTMQDMLLALNNATSMSHLHTLEIGVQTRTLPGDPLFRPTDSGDLGRSLLPNLQHICLSRISLAELPITTFPRLRTLTLHWPAQYPTTRPTLFRMSTVLAFLQRAPRLESLNLLKSSPLMDVLPLRRDAANHHGSATAGSHGIIFSPVCMTALRYLEWSYAPPRDLYRLFLYLDSPNLRRLELRLDSAEQRWFTFYDARLEPLDEEQEHDENSPLFLRDGKMRPFTQLVELHLHVSDISGLCLAVRRMAFPQLRHLTLVFLHKRAIRLSAKADNHRRSGLGIMPSLDSILHEPRLATLTHLTLSGFDLECSAAMCTLAYLRSLECLTFDKCEGMFTRLILRSMFLVTNYGSLRCGPGDLCSWRREMRKYSRCNTQLDMSTSAVSRYH